MDLIIPKVSLPPEPKAVGSQTLPNGAGGTAPEHENHQEAYQVFEARDENQVVAALKGRYLDDFVYRFCRRHRSPDAKLPPECTCSDVVVGLSWLGIQEAAREYKGIRVPIEKLTKRETEDAVEIMVEAVDDKTGNSRIGIATQQKKLRLRTGALITDEFCVSKAVAKAQRNAIRPLLPVTLIKAWIEAKLKGPAAVTVAVAALPAPATPQALQTSVPAPNGTEKPPAGPASAVTPKPVQQDGNGGWHISPGQVKRIFGLAFAHSVSREQVKELLSSICGVADPALIDSRKKLDQLYAALENGGVPF